MRYIDLNGTGEPDVMVMAEGEKPVLQENDVLIRVAAAGVNRPDIAQRRGLYPPPADASPVLGLEVSGEIVALGNGVNPKMMGNQVCALANGGGYAEYVAVPAAQCLPVPRGLSMIEAAALPETFFTVWANVFDRGRLATGESFLVHGGSSGIGSVAIQLAKHFGARVFATAGSEEKCNFCKKLGADIAVNYREQDFVEVLMKATDNKGVDVILDMVGGDYIQRNIQLAAVDGRIEHIAFLAGASAEVNFAAVMMKRLTISGSTLRPRTAEVKAEIARQLQNHVWSVIESGHIAPAIAATFPIDDVVKAHQLMESNEHMGKIVLTL